jgi:hypothetical protein
MSVINPQRRGRWADPDGETNNGDRAPVVIEQLIAHVLGQAHRTAEAQNAPHEARDPPHGALVR